MDGGRLTVAIMAGGESRRMGRNKALLPVADRPLIAWLVALAHHLGEDVLVVARDPAPYTFLGVPIVTDRFPGVGPLAGLHAALDAAPGEWVLALACDMPFIEPRVIHYLRTLAGQEVDVVMPRVRGREEPLHALYRRGTCLPAVEDAIRAGKRRVISFLPRVRVHYVPEEALRRVTPDLRSFHNVNTPEEWARVQEEVVRHFRALLPGEEAPPGETSQKNSAKEAP